MLYGNVKNLQVKQSKIHFCWGSFFISGSGSCQNVSGSSSNISLSFVISISPKSNVNNVILFFRKVAKYDILSLDGWFYETRSREIKLKWSIDQIDLIGSRFREIKLKWSIDQIDPIGSESLALLRNNLQQLCIKFLTSNFQFQCFIERKSTSKSGLIKSNFYADPPPSRPNELSFSQKKCSEYLYLFSEHSFNFRKVHWLLSWTQLNLENLERKFQQTNKNKFWQIWWI